jgi:ribulose-5-phosphate 4-epimerase/fuculose-1-phosphate aldolase
MVIGPDIGRTFVRLYYLEQACRLQLLAMQTHQPLEEVSDNLARPVRQAIQADLSHGDIFLTAIKRALDRQEPDYRS